MNSNLCKLVDRIRERFPRLDVRTDQCDTVRVITKGVLVGIFEQENEFKAEFTSLDEECDFETTMLKTVSSTDLGDFEAVLLQALVDLVPHH